jgi:hypothetical protein
MKAHIIHDAHGAIRSLVIQSTQVPGELEIHPEKDELVTIVDLTEVFPEMTVDMGQENTKHELSLVARQIRSDFRLNPQRKTLERLK